MTSSITQTGIQLNIFEDNHLGDLEKVLLLFQTLSDKSLLEEKGEMIIPTR